MPSSTALPIKPSNARGKRVLALLLAFAPALAQGHPGHAGDGLWAGVLHPLHGLDHVLAALAVGVWAAQLQGPARYALPAAFVAAMAGGAALALAGLAVPGMEPMIAVSVLGLGALIAFDARLSPLAGLVLIIALAPFHGAAHVAELPATASVAAFALGLMIATGLLHAAGVGMTFALRRRASLLRAAALSMVAAGLGMLIARMTA